MLSRLDLRHFSSLISRGSRRSRSPVNRRSRSRSESQTRSGSRSRSKSYSVSITPDNPLAEANRTAATKAPTNKRRLARVTTTKPDPRTDEETRSRPLKYDGKYVWKKARTNGSMNSYKREKAREQSRSPVSRRLSRLRYRGKYEHGCKTS